jgi:hypothetical protein
MRFILSVLFTALLAMPALAQPWYARGQFNNWSTDNPMTDQGGGHWTAAITGLFDDQPYNWKIAVADWSVNMPTSDSRVYTDALGEINFHLYDQTTWDDGWFPNNVRRVGYNDHQQFDWEIVGSFNGWPGGMHDPAYAMTDMGNGLHRGTFTFDTGIYDFKFRGVGADPLAVWDTSIGNNFGNGAGNNSFAVTADDQEWTFELDLPNGRFRYFTEAAPSNDGDYNDDGVVDAADYIPLRKYFGTNTVLPNDPHGGTIGQAQMDTWRSNFGNTGGPAAQWLARSPQFADTPLVAQGGGVYTLSVTGLTAGTDYDIQAVKSDLSEQAPGSHAKIRADAAGEINLTLYELNGASWSDGWNPSAADRFGYEDSQLTDWEIVGAFNGWPGANDPLFAMTDQGNGLHTGTFTFDTPGTYGWKFRQIAETNPWNMSIGNDFGNSAADNVLTITNIGEEWTFELDLPNGRWRAYMAVPGGGSAVPEPGTIVMALVAALAICGTRRRK